MNYPKSFLIFVAITFLKYSFPLTKITRISTYIPVCKLKKAFELVLNSTHTIFNYFQFRKHNNAVSQRTLYLS
ncbi:hypothetical protein A8C32_14630 [Flavivirga aquatica]|uniref:Uncharacterized protein n=1 Tax=Flavivirga aquatica TaxID=1849968 RepID=A0A1E5TC27_9FLAO|nr:hypothetical protein A8C32_14630 [Flavivirga aquatica]